MSPFWQQFTDRAFKTNIRGCEWISATNHFCPKPELAIVGKKYCGLRQPGGVGEVSEPQLFRGDTICSSKWRLPLGPKIVGLARKPACRMKSPCTVRSGPMAAATSALSENTSVTRQNVLRPCSAPEPITCRPSRGCGHRQTRTDAHARVHASAS